jgi:hypothetical protein
VRLDQLVGDFNYHARNGLVRPYPHRVSRAQASDSPEVLLPRCRVPPLGSAGSANHEDPIARSGRGRQQSRGRCAVGKATEERLAHPSRKAKLAVTMIEIVSLIASTVMTTSQIGSVTGSV